MRTFVFPRTGSVMSPKPPMEEPHSRLHNDTKAGLIPDLQQHDTEQAAESTITSTAGVQVGR